MKTTKFAILAGIPLAVGVPVAFAQLEVGGDLLDNCADIDPLQSAGNFAQAADAAQLCLEGLQQQLAGEVAQFFLPVVGAWTRTGLEQNQVLGFTNIMAEYDKDNILVTVSLTGTSGVGGGLGDLGGLIGGFAQSAILQTGQQVTVAGLPGSVQPDGTITVLLEDGSVLNFESSDLNSADAALAGMGDLVNDFPVADINAALQ